MRHVVLLFVCLLSCLSAVSANAPAETKILVPVVLEPHADAGALNLQATDFTVDGPRGIRIESAQLVPAEAMNDAQHTPLVFIVYDAFLTPGPVQGTLGAQLMKYLEGVAQRHDPVTLVVNQGSGLKPVYDFGTDPKLLADALDAVNQNRKVDDPKVKEQVERLKLLKSYTPVPLTPDQVTAAQLTGLEQISRLLQRSPNRKALLWLTWNYWLGTGEYTKYFMGSQRGVGATASIPEAIANAQADTRFTGLPPLYQHTIDALNTAHVSVYPLQQYDRRNTSLTLNDRSLWFTAEGLKQVAACTGGFSFKDFRNTTLDEAVSAVRADFGPYYMLTATVPEIKRTDWVGLKVKVNKPGLTARSAPGFLGLSPGAAKAAGISGK